MTSERRQSDGSTSSPGDCPLVAILVPFLNARPFIAETMESIFAQTYPRWEVLLIDDGSTDGSSEMAREYAAGDPERVRYLEHEGHANRGASASRNLGLKHARGGLIALLDADDVWLPRKLEDQIAILKANPEASMVYGFTEYWYSWTGQPEDQSLDHVPDLGFEVNRLYQPPSMYPAMFFRGEVTTPCTCSLLLRREAIDRSGGFEDSFLKIFTDQAFYAKLFLREPAYVASGCWDRYRQNPNSCCRTAERAGQIEEARRTFMIWLEGYFRANGYEGTRLWRGLQRAMLKYRRPRTHRLIKALESVAFAPRKASALVRRWLRHTGRYNASRRLDRPAASGKPEPAAPMASADISS